MSCCNPLRESFRATKLQTVVEVESVDVECYTLCHIRDIIKKAVLGRPCPFKKEWRSLIICCKGTSFIQYFQIFCKLFRGLYLFYVFGESPSISPRSLPSSVICRTVAKSSCELSFTPFTTSKRFVIYTGWPLLLVALVLEIDVNKGRNHHTVKQFLDGLGRIGRETWSQCRWANFYRLHSSGLLSTNFPMASMPQIISSIPKKSFSSTFLALHNALRLAPSGNMLVNTGKMRSE